MFRLRILVGSVALLSTLAAVLDARPQVASSSVHHGGWNPREPLVSEPVFASKKIGNDGDDFPDTLDDHARFGRALAALGDLDGDGIGDLAVGVDDGLTSTTGAVWILFLDADQSVRQYEKIAENRSGFTGDLDFGDGFGASVAAVGDLDGDGFTELAVGAPADDGDSSDSNVDSGAVWILFLDGNGRVKAHEKIANALSGSAGALQYGGGFGSSLAPLGDLNGDGVEDLAVGAPFDDSRGAVWVLFLEADGGVGARRKIGDGPGRTRPAPGTEHAEPFAGKVHRADWFGSALASLGDLDGDGLADLAVGAPGVEGDFSGLGVGAVWVLFLDPDGGVHASQEIGEDTGGFTGLQDRDSFGSSLAALGDLDGDGSTDLAVGAPRDGVSTGERGAVWVLFLGEDGVVQAQQKINATSGAFAGTLDTDDRFGTAVAGLGDVDGDGVADLAVGATDDDDGGPDRGAVWALRLEPDGTVDSHAKISESEGGFASTLEEGDDFGSAVAVIGDLDGDGVSELAVGAPGDDDGGLNHGAVWVLYPDAQGTVRSYHKISDTEGGFGGTLGTRDGFGNALARLGDVDGNGVADLAVGAPGLLDDFGFGNNAVWVLFLDAEGNVQAQQEIGPGVGGFAGPLGSSDRFGCGLASPGDLDGDGVPELVVGAPWHDDGGQDHGAVWVLFLAANGTVQAQQKISATAGGFTGSLQMSDSFGASVASPGDLDGDGVNDLVVGASGRGAVWVLFLAPDGTVNAHQEISTSAGGFTGSYDSLDDFGASVASLGDLDGDGVVDLAVGAPGTSSGPAFEDRQQGALWVLFLRADGTVHANVKVGRDQGGFTGALTYQDFFGTSVASLGDLDGDGVVDLAAGSRWDDGGGDHHGALWLLTLDGIATVDFEGRDDQARTPLANGQDLSSPPELGRTLEITSTGVHLGPAIFDSTSGGPNDAGPGRDLLVGLGNVLVLQSSAHPTQTNVGRFDVPDADRNGGTITFTFQTPVAPRSLDLIAIASVAVAPQAPRGGHLAEIDAWSRVQLFDTSNRTRRYSIPMGWTEALLRDGPPGFRTLDLTTLEPQPGFLGSATVFEDPGFDPDAVEAVEVRFAGEGALDNLRWAPHQGP